jgi:catechol 2,3-dioxygenase-like lactoylglutathione lyase family enzyme
MLGAAPMIAFVPTMDLDGARAFYADKLGLQVEEQTEFAVALVGGGSRLRATLVETLDPQPFTILGWMVDDIATKVGAMRSQGVMFTVYDGLGQDRDGIWTAPGGVKIAWFRDPDGNTLSLTEFPR